MNYNQLAYEATMYFECQTDFGRWVKYSFITMSLFIVIPYTFLCNVNKHLLFNTINNLGIARTTAHLDYSKVYIQSQGVQCTRT